MQYLVCTMRFLCMVLVIMPGMASATTTTSLNQETSTATLVLAKDWNLVSSRVPISDVATTFMDAQTTTSVWAWDTTAKNWQVFLAGESPAGAYATAKGFSPLLTIAPGTGFWLNSKAGQPLTITGTAATANTIILNDGWNLKGLTSTTPVTVATVFNDLSKYASIWKWTGATWSVFIPEEMTVGAYAKSKGFDPLSTLLPGEGFWVNVNPGQAGTITITGMDGGQTVGIDGGGIVSADLKVHVDLLPRAVLADTEISVTPLSSFPPDDRLIPNTVYGCVGGAVPFHGRVSLAITYDPLALPGGVKEDDLVIGELVAGEWQPLFGALVDPEANTVSVVIEQGGTYGVLNSQRVNSVVAYVVATPTAPNQFGDIGAAVDSLCQNLQPGQKGGVVVQKSPVSLGTLNLTCDVEIKAEDNTAPTIDVAGGNTINTLAPVTLVGLSFSGATTINTGADLTLTNNTFADLSLNPGAAPGQSLNKGLAKSLAMSSTDPGCFSGNTLLKQNTVAGTLSLGGDLKLCGNTLVQKGEVTTLDVGGNIEFTQQAKLEVNGPLLKTITAEAKFSGSASTTVASIHGNDLSTFKMHLIDGDITLNQLNHEISGTVIVKTDGPAEFTLNQDALTVGSKYVFDAADMGLTTTTHYFARVTVDGESTLSGGGTVQGTYKDTTFKGKFLATMGLNALQLGLDQFDTKFEGEVRHNLLTDQADQRLDLIVRGHASTTYQKGIETCISTGASALVEYSDSIIKNFGTIQVGLSAFGKKSCAGGGGNKQAPLKTLASQAGDPGEFMVKNMVYTDQPLVIGLEIKDLDMPVTVEHNQVQGQILGMRVANVSKTVLINDNTITAVGGVELLGLAEATYSNNQQSDDTGLIINVQPSASGVLSHVAVTDNTFGPEGVILAGPFGTAIITATGNTLYGVENGPGCFMGLSGNTFTGGDASDPGGGFFIDPGKGNNSGLYDELNIFTNIDWSGNGCADYPPSSDAKDADGLCLSDDGLAPPVLPLSP